jgi:hypothetical protein
MGKVVQEFKNRPVRDGGIIEPDKLMVEALESLRHRVDHMNKFPKLLLVGDTYRELDLDDFRWVQYENIKFGYHIDFFKVGNTEYLKRNVVLVLNYYKLDELNDSDRKKILASLMRVFFVEGADIPSIEQMDDFAMIFTQNIPVMYQFEQNPNIIVPGKKG